MCSINDFFSILISMVWHFDVRLRNIYVTILSTVACRVFEFFFFSFLFFQYLYFTSFILHEKHCWGTERLFCATYYMENWKVSRWAIAEIKIELWLNPRNTFSRKRRKTISVIILTCIYLGIFLGYHVFHQEKFFNKYIYWRRLWLLDNSTIISASMKWLGITLITLILTN